VNLIRGSATLIHAGIRLIRVGMGTIRGHVGWNCSGVTDDRPPTTDERAWIRATVCRRSSSLLFHLSSVISHLSFVSFVPLW
jgi:hypothetical protein